ncbi:hypothetical protein H5410_043004 [Solanum commersonii]|uniref:Uncharacterized protein n=1 Tax=Solanum commersonii TaxID=4109 RepID=A0A9J5XXL7_SOLCO|nr:hypothetical protein H5410_043004 [Solanum commersonii]
MDVGVAVPTSMDPLSNTCVKNHWPSHLRNITPNHRSFKHMSKPFVYKKLIGVFTPKRPRKVCFNKLTGIRLCSSTFRLSTHWLIPMWDMYALQK